PRRARAGARRDFGRVARVLPARDRVDLHGAGAGGGRAALPLGAARLRERALQRRHPRHRSLADAAAALPARVTRRRARTPSRARTGPAARARQVGSFDSGSRWSNWTAMPSVPALIASMRTILAGSVSSSPLTVTVTSSGISSLVTK